MLSIKSEFSLVFYDTLYIKIWSTHITIVVAKDKFKKSGFFVSFQIHMYNIYYEENIIRFR